jgi:uncharacterized coiled-coil protein SlyX
MTMAAIRRIIELEQRLAEVVRQRDDLATRLSEASAERVRLTHQLRGLLERGDEGGVGRSGAGSAGTHRT